MSLLVQEADRTRIPYQTLINSILKQEMDRRKLSMTPALNAEELTAHVKELELKFGIISAHLPDLDREKSG
jgi:hypothetical protein